MAVNPIQFLVAQNASITDGTKTITVSGNVDCSRVFSGTAVFLGGADNPAEAVSGTSPNGSGVSTITLRNNWSQGDIVNQQLVSFNTNEGLAEAISNVREIVSNVSAIEDLATQGLIKRISDNEYEVVNISAVGESLITANDASSQRSVLGLGSAATRDVTSSNTDATIGRLMQTGDGGINIIGTTTMLGDMLDPSIPSGLHAYTDSTLNIPFPIAGSDFGTVLVTRRQSAQNQRTLVVFGMEESKSFPITYRTISNTFDSGWQELYHGGNSVNPLDYGLGVLKDSIAPNISNFDTNKTSGLFRTVGNETGTPQNSSIASIINLKRGGTDAVNQVFIRGDEASNTGQMHFRGGVGSSFSDWFELYHSGNTNFNEVLGDGTTGIVLWGHAYNTTEIRFYVPIFFNKVASGVTVNGTFSLSYFQNPTATGLDGTDIQFLSASRNVAVLRITSLSGLDMTKQYGLFAEQASAKITVNF